MSNLPTNPGDRLSRRERRGAATVRLSSGPASQAADLASMMDPATKSLADALRVSYWALQVAIVILIFLFLFSGFTSVTSAERGIKLRFGHIVDPNLEAGAHWSWPAPLGAILKVPTGNQTVEIRKQFFPNLSDDEEKNLAANGSTVLADGGSDSLDPNVDGQLITADGGIAHARWNIVYRHDEGHPDINVRNIPDEESEQRIVRAVVMQSIVTAASSVTLDELMRNVPDPRRPENTFEPVEVTAKQLAQARLDKLGSGILLESVTMTQKFPPRRVMSRYYQVQAAESQSAAQIEQAITQRRQSLQAAAGDAAETILAEIDRYELELAAGDAAASEATLTRINSLLLGESVEIEGKPTHPRVSGEVASLLDDARQERTSMVAQAKADVDIFNAKLKAFKVNPTVLLNGDWADAYRAFASRENTQIMLLPPGARSVVLINRDPALTREQEMARYGREFDEGNRTRMRELQRKRFEERQMDGMKVAE